MANIEKWVLSGASGRMVKYKTLTGFVADVDILENAKIIVCAPEMLEFLYSIESSENTPAEHRRKAKELIKKATE